MLGMGDVLVKINLKQACADTVEANEQLGFEADLRKYRLPPEILNYFHLQSVRLLSNNPEKIQALEESGIRVAERIPCLVAPVDSSEEYLRTKKQKLGHLLEGF